MTVDAIRECILLGRYLEGDPLRQDAIGAELGVSRVPVREALRQLEAEGLVILHPHRGAVVSVLSLKQIGELFELRAEIEGDLIRRAVPSTKTEDHDKADEILDAYEDALREGHVSLCGALNWRFHSTLYAAAERELTMRVVSKLHRQSDRYARIQLTLTQGEMRARQEHRAIAAAARKRDSVKACRLMREHIIGAGRALVEFLATEQRAKTPRPARRRSGIPTERATVTSTPSG